MRQARHMEGKMEREEMKEREQGKKGGRKRVEKKEKGDRKIATREENI